MNANISPSPKKPDVPASTNDLKDICVAGITPFTTIDFPGRLAGVFYLQGCPWRCRYCYNSEFWPLPAEGQGIPLEKVLHFLDSRKSQLDGIVFSGGEPTLHERLPVWMKAVKALGFEIGLHTGGIYPERLKEALPVCDWVGMDIKAPFVLYEKITQVPQSGEAVRKSAEMLVASRVPHEFRTTFHPGLLSEDEVLAMARELSALSVPNYVIQSFHPEHCPDKELRESALPGTGISLSLRSTLRSLFPSFHVRE
jgi:pyruvate formate lyase activating enzyme